MNIPKSTTVECDTSQEGTSLGHAFAGIQALRSILNKFSVNNRKNMFVFRESNQEAVFYLRSADLYLVMK